MIGKFSEKNYDRMNHFGNDDWTKKNIRSNKVNWKYLKRNKIKGETCFRSERNEESNEKDSTLKANIEDKHYPTHMSHQKGKK